LGTLIAVMLLGGPVCAVAIAFALKPKVEILDTSVNPMQDVDGWPRPIEVRLEKFGQRTPYRKPRSFPWLFD
jgi:hypothetical protein